MDTVWNLTILVAVAGAIYWTCRPRPLFRLIVCSGRVQVATGTVTPACLDQIQAICDMHGITEGSVSGFARRSGRIHVSASRQFTPGAVQQLRNWWAEFGWSGPSGDRPPPRQASACR